MSSYSKNFNNQLNLREKFYYLKHKTVYDQSQTYPTILILLDGPFNFMSGSDEKTQRCPI